MRRPQAAEAASHHPTSKLRSHSSYHVLDSPNPFAECLAQSSPPRKPSCATTPRPNWAWLYKYDCAVILWERSDYFLSKTAFLD